MKSAVMAELNNTNKKEQFSVKGSFTAVTHTFGLLCAFWKRAHWRNAKAVRADSGANVNCLAQLVPMSEYRKHALSVQAGSTIQFINFFSLIPLLNLDHILFSIHLRDPIGRPKLKPSRKISLSSSSPSPLQATIPGKIQQRIDLKWFPEPEYPAKDGPFRGRQGKPTQSLAVVCSGFLCPDRSHNACF